MDNFEYWNPTRIIFGCDTIARIADLIPAQSRILMIYGGGSIKRNGVHAQVIAALADRQVVEFAGIEPNPRYETCMEAVALLQRESCDFCLAVGGGSVFDATKFICAAARFDAGDPWDICARQAPVADAVPWGGVLTLPATGSEMNPTSVINRDSSGEKLFFANDLVRPLFSILDPQTTFSLDRRQTANGIVDAFAHVCEQYLTVDNAAPLQDRQAEAVLLTLIEEGPKVMAAPHDYQARANLMWCATNGLNGYLGVGQRQDWATHMIGHELTALYGIDHARTLAVVMPGVWQHQRERKRAKLLQYAARIWELTNGDEEARIDAAIAKTEAFWRALGVGTTFADYHIPDEACDLVPARMAERGMQVGEHGDLGHDEVAAILRLRRDAGALTADGVES